MEYLLWAQMTLLEEAIQYTQGNEGGFSNHPKDKGGPTNMGVTLKTLREASAKILGHDFDKDNDGDVDIDDLKLLDAKDIGVIVTKLGYWNTYFERLPRAIAIKAFDQCYLCGIRSGVKLLQRACNRAWDQGRLVEDGSMGPKTLFAASSLPTDLLMICIIQVLKEHFRKIVEHDPEQAVFLNGWNRRAERRP